MFKKCIPSVKRVEYIVYENTVTFVRNLQRLFGKDNIRLLEGSNLLESETFIEIRLDPQVYIILKPNYVLVKEDDKYFTYSIKYFEESFIKLESLK